MLKKIWRNKAILAGVLLLVTLLALLRLYEKQLFYDPFLEFFKGEFQNAPLPNYKAAPLFFGIFCRYLLNSGVSLAIIFVIYKDAQLLKVVSFLYLIFFVLLVVAFFALLYFCEKPDVLVLFYLRRFLLQPLFLVLFLPAIYYQKKKLQSDSRQG